MADNGNPKKKNAAASIAFAWGKQTALQGTTSRKWTSSIEVNSALSLVLSTIIGKKLTISSAQILPFCGSISFSFSQKNLHGIISR